MKMKFLRLFILFLLVATSFFEAFATHQRAGEISYKYISGLTYEFTIITYTFTPSPADRPEIEVFWGDGTSTEIERVSKVNLDNEISKNTYIAQHTFSAVGTFHITFEDPNRNAGIVNIPSSVEIPFFIETILVINPFIEGNSSPQLLNPPLDNGCTNVPFYHNPGAYDADGDSLSYSLIACRGYNGEEIPGYSFPFASSFLEIDPVTGDLTWDSPTLAGEYNIAILITEWRNGMMISSMVRDMQITIAPCNNLPPEVFVEDTCVVAGNRIDIPVYVFDSTSTYVTLSASGAPFMTNVSPAQFATITDSVPYMTHFVWNTDCSHIQNSPYEVIFKAKDNGPHVELVSYKTLRIRVIAPAPTNLVATPEGNSVHLDWSPTECSNALGYDIYRRNGCDDYLPDSCATGVASMDGYMKIGSTFSWSDTTFIDDGSVFPLYHGNEYSYRVVAIFSGSAESVVSENACAHIANDAPLIINADVVETDESDGKLLIRWLFPPEIDSLAFPAPYTFQLFRVAQNDEMIPLFFVDAPENANDTLSFVDSDLNTSDSAFSYRVFMFSGENLIEKSDPATSIFLNSEPLDRKISLSWTDIQPWKNVKYTLFRKDPNSETWDSVATSETTSYVDYNLENGSEYCYYILAEGYYQTSDTIGPLFNKSQRICTSPVDNQPPEVPEITVFTDCRNVEIQWFFQSDSAAADAVYYFVYYKPTLTGNFTCIDSFSVDDICTSALPCSYQLSTAGSDVVVGCFAVQVADSNRNYSPLSDSVCIDIFDCIDYRLPNVFTPNGDNYNDLFTPFMPYSGVSKINIEIYNRWGKRVFHTDNPDILWDGTDETTNLQSSEGVYFYSCTLFINSLSGEVSYLLNGSVTLVR